MYRPDEMAMLLEQAKQYTNSQRLAHKEKTVITWDGNTDGKEILPMPLMENKEFYLVSDNTVDLNNVKKLSVVTENNNVEHDVDCSELVIGDEGDFTFLGVGIGNMAYVLTCNTDFEMEGVAFKKGTYFLKESVDPFSYINRIETETIHPIPQEYIPPLDRLILNGADGNQYALTITDGAISVAPVTT